jgi:hypothetical protein
VEADMQRTYTILGSAIGLARLANACPLCHSNTAEEVRAGILTTAQNSTVVAALIGPFAALALVLALLNRFLPATVQSKIKKNEKESV